MKIGIVASIFPPYSVGGAEISAHYLSKGLARTGHDVLVITPNYGRKTTTDEKDGVIIHRFSFPGVLNEQLPNKIMSNPLVYSSFTKNIKSAMKWFKPDIIHAQHSTVFIPTFKAGKSKTIATLRDYTSFCDSGYCSLRRQCRQCSFLEYLKCKYRWNPSTIRSFHYPYDYVNLRWKQKTLRKMGGVISVSNAVRETYKTIGIESTVIHNIAPEIEINEKTDIKKDLNISGKVVTFIGKVSIGKGADHFLEMAKSLKDVTFIIAGTGPLKNDFINASKEYENIKYLGRVPYDKVLQIYKASDVVCSTSVWPEPLSRIPIEALSIGTPCVATNVGGTGEIIDDGVNGFLVNPGNVEDLKEKVKILLSDKRIRNKFIKNGKEKIRKEFSINKITNKHITFYKQVMGLK